jgi:hypothetical protein
MLDTKVILALALLLGSAMISIKKGPDDGSAGGIPIPPVGRTGAGNFH